MILITLLVVGGYFSYAMFTVSKEKGNAISIVTGNLEYKLTKKGDLIFRLSLPSKIILVDEKTEGLLINNLYCIIRCNNKKIKKN